MELRCIRNKSLQCWNKVVGMDYIESQTCTLNIECPEPFLIPVSE